MTSHLFALASLVSTVILVSAELRGAAVVRVLAKTAASAAFVAYALAVGAASAGSAGRWVVVALALSMVGDLLLLSSAERWFLGGLVAFLFAHVAFVAAFLTLGVAWGAVGAAAVPLGLLALQVWLWLSGHVGSLRAPVIAYIAVICAMVACAVGAVVLDPTAGRLGLAVSAVLFFLSDLCVARDRFVTPGPENRMLGLPLYYLAQVGFAGSIAAAVAGCAAAGAADGEAWAPSAGVAVNGQLDPREKHLADLRQLTVDGENAEAYFTPDGRHLIYQRTGPGEGCDQQYLLDLTTGESVRVSSGKGRTTCGYTSWPKGDRLLYATTEGGGPACPPPPDHSKGYVWALYDSFDLVWQDGPRGSPVPFLPAPGYDAEATVCMTDGRVVFTSTRDGDLDLYSVRPDGTALTRLTRTPGYDGGAFFTKDCQHIVWRASRPAGDERTRYQALLAENLVAPSKLELYVMKADGTEVKQLTSNGAANFGPYPLHDGSGVIFASNMGGSPREFDLWRVPMTGGEPERITWVSGFDGFPIHSPDGRWLVFASNRADPSGQQTNLYVARWVP